MPAGPLTDLVTTARAAFGRLPDVRMVEALDDLCGGAAEGPGIYCTSENRIYLTPTDTPEEALYTVAHLFGHGLQVQYGLADIALMRIRSDRSQEADVRGKVTRQVECFAGMLLARAGVAMPPLDRLFDAEPMTGSHWGRDPVAQGPRVSIGMAARAEWFAKGYAAADPAACTVGDLPADLVFQADAGR